jgi:hypothetical protein
MLFIRRYLAWPGLESSAGHAIPFEVVDWSREDVPLDDQ